MNKHASKEEVDSNSTLRSESDQAPRRGAGFLATALMVLAIALPGLPTVAAVTDGCGNTIPTLGYASGFETYGTEWDDSSSPAGWGTGIVAKTGSYSLATVDFSRPAQGAYIAYSATAESGGFDVPNHAPSLEVSHRRDASHAASYAGMSLRYNVDGNWQSFAIPLAKTSGSWATNTYDVSAAAGHRAYFEATVIYTASQGVAYGNYYLFDNGGLYVDDVKLTSTTESVDPAAPNVDSSSHPAETQNLYSGLNGFSVHSVGQDVGEGVYGYSWDLVTNTAPALDSCIDTVGNSTSSYLPSLPLFGTVSYRVRAIDWHGNWGPVTTYAFGVDRVAPDVERTEPANGGSGVSPTAPITVRYSDRDVVSGTPKDGSETATRVSVSSVRVYVDGEDVMGRDAEACATLGNDAPILGPVISEVAGDVQAAYHDLQGHHYIGPVRVTIMADGLNGFLDPVFDELQDSPTPPSEDVPGYGSAVDAVCAGAVITPNEFSYQPRTPWSSGTHTARIEFTDDAVGHANERVYNWSFTVA